MNILAMILVILVAVLHVMFLVLEMFMWTTPTGRKIFRRTEQQAKDSEVLAKNQGLYNGFLAAGLIWSLTLHPQFSIQSTLFFLGCVIVASIYGSITSTKSIFFIQGIPAILALVVSLIAHQNELTSAYWVIPHP